MSSRWLFEIQLSKIFLSDSQNGGSENKAGVDVEGGWFMDTMHRPGGAQKTDQVQSLISLSSILASVLITFGTMECTLRVFMIK